MRVAIFSIYYKYPHLPKRLWGRSYKSVAGCSTQPVWTSPLVQQGFLDFRWCRWQGEGIICTYTEYENNCFLSQCPQTAFVGDLQEYFNDRNHSILWNVGLSPASCTKQLTGVGKPLCGGSFQLVRAMRNQMGLRVLYWKRCRCSHSYPYQNTPLFSLLSMKC